MHQGPIPQDQLRALVAAGRVPALLEVVFFDPFEHWGRLVVWEPVHGGRVFFRVRWLPESILGPSTEAFRAYRRAPKNDRELRAQLRRRVKDLLLHVYFRAELEADKHGDPSLVVDTIRPIETDGGEVVE